MLLTITRKPIRSLRIKVSPDGKVCVSVPKRLSDEYIQKFVESKKARIEKTLEKMRKGKEKLSVGEDEILLFGKGYTFVHDESLGKTVLIDHEEKRIESSYDLMHVGKQKIWYKSYAKEYLQQKLDELAKKHGMNYAKLFVRDQKTKRGTCSSKKNIGLNRKLIKMPEEIAAYVICHELAHLREMNHSKRFWAVVEEFYPDYKNAVMRMKKYGMSLQ